MIRLGINGRGRQIFCPNCEVYFYATEEDIEWKNFRGLTHEEGEHFFARCMDCKTAIIIPAAVIPESIQKKAREKAKNGDKPPPPPAA